MSEADHIASIRREMDVLVDMELIREIIVNEQIGEDYPLENRLRANIEAAEEVSQAILFDPFLEAACVARGEVDYERGRMGDFWGTATVSNSVNACLDDGARYRRKSMLDTLMTGEGGRAVARLGLESTPYEDDSYERTLRERYDKLLAEEEKVSGNLYERVGAPWKVRIYNPHAIDIFDATYAAVALHEVRKEHKDLDMLRKTASLLRDAERTEESQHAAEAADDLEAALQAKRTEEAKIAEASVLVSRAEDGVQLRHGRGLYKRIGELRDRLESEVSERERKRTAAQHKEEMEREGDRDFIPGVTDTQREENE